MSSSVDWFIVSPAPRSAVLELAGPRARMRRCTLAQGRSVESAAIFRGDRALSVAWFGRHGWRRVEMAMLIAPDAWPHMRRLVRAAQLTLAGIAETHLVVIRIHPDNPAGQRMAVLAGFRRARTKNPAFWIFRGDEHGRHTRRKRPETRGAEGAAGIAGRG